MSDKLDISIIIPVFNEGPYLAECLDSIIAQREINVEICISDNASSDNTWDIIQSYENKAVIRSFRMPKTVSPFENTIKVAEMAQGRFVLFLGGDDYLLPNTLKPLIDRLDNNKHLAGNCLQMTYCSDETGEQAGPYPPNSYGQAVANPEMIVPFALSHINYDNFIYGVYYREDFEKAIKRTSQYCLESPGLLLFIVLAKSPWSARGGVAISEEVCMIKRYAKSTGAQSTRPTSERLVVRELFFIKKFMTSVWITVQFYRIGIYSTNEVLLLLFSSRYHSVRGWHSPGIVLFPFWYILRRIAHFLRKHIIRDVSV